jgi:hypothetical protein
MMTIRPRPFSLLALAPLALGAAPQAIAEVYKGIGPDGDTFYSDQPVDGAEEVRLPNTAPPADAVPAANGEATPGDAVADAGPYTSLEILTPTEGETIRDVDRKVRVSLLVEPPIREGHRLSIEIDGTPATGLSEKATQVRLRGLPLGSHRLQTRVLDAEGNVVAQSKEVHFHVRRPLPEAALP